MPKYWSAGYPLSSRGEKLIPTLPPTPTLTLTPNQVETAALAPRLTARQLLLIDGLNRDHLYLAQGG